MEAIRTTTYRVHSSFLRSCCCKNAIGHTSGTGGTTVHYGIIVGRLPTRFEINLMSLVDGRLQWPKPPEQALDFQ